MSEIHAFILKYNSARARRDPIVPCGTEPRARKPWGCPVFPHSPPRDRPFDDDVATTTTTRDDREDARDRASRARVSLRVRRARERERVVRDRAREAREGAATRSGVVVRVGRDLDSLVR